MDSEPGPTLEPAVLLSILTAVAYAAAFAFEAANAGAFGIPLDMVDLQLMPALFRMLVALSVLATIWNVLGQMVDTLTDETSAHPLVRALRPFVTLLSVGLVAWIIVQPVPWSTVGWYSLFLVGALFVELVLPLMHFQVEGYLGKLRHDQAIRDGFSGQTWRSLRSNKALFRTIVLSIILIAMGALAGNTRGQRQQDFYMVVGANPETIVLRIYGDRGIAAEFVRAEKRISPVYRFLRLDDPKVALRLERVGPITFTTGDTVVAPVRP